MLTLDEALSVLETRGLYLDDGADVWCPKAFRQEAGLTDRELLEQLVALHVDEAGHGMLTNFSGPLLAVTPQPTAG